MQISAIPRSAAWLAYEPSWTALSGERFVWRWASSGRSRAWAVGSAASFGISQSLCGSTQSGAGQGRLSWSDKSARPVGGRSPIVPPAPPSPTQHRVAPRRSMSFEQAVLLSAIAGATIFLGLPVGRLRNLSTRTQALLTTGAAGVILFLIWDILAAAVEPVESSIVAASQGENPGDVWVNLAAFAVSI